MSEGNEALLPFRLVWSTKNSSIVLNLSVSPE